MGSDSYLFQRIKLGRCTKFHAGITICMINVIRTLTTQGYSQSQGVDYQDVFSPVVRYSSIRSLLAVAKTCDWEVHQMDVKTAFLQGDLDEEIYMKQPDGYIDKERPNHVCKLKKSKSQVKNTFYQSVKVPRRDFEEIQYG